MYQDSEKAMPGTICLMTAGPEIWDSLQAEPQMQTVNEEAGRLTVTRVYANLRAKAQRRVLPADIGK